MIHESRAGESADRPNPYFPIYWASQRPALPDLLARAVLHAVNEGLIAVEALADRTADWMSDAAAAGRLLEHCGGWDAYRRDVLARAFVPRCPFWCDGEHEQLVDARRGLFHTLPVARWIREDGHTMAVVIQAWEDTTEVGEPHILEVGFEEFDAPTMLDVVRLAEALVEASAALERIQGLSTDGPPPTTA